MYILLRRKIRIFPCLKSVCLTPENPAKQYSLVAVKLSGRKSVKYIQLVLAAIQSSYFDFNSLMIRAFFIKRDIQFRFCEV